MRNLVICTVHLYLLLFLVVFSYASVASEKSPKRSKISSIYLTPTLRVGRRSEGVWETSPEAKRRVGKLMAFPRVGRDGGRRWLAEEDFMSKRSGNTGMWFGPRLGRVQKRDIGDESAANPWTYILVNENPPLAQTHFGPRLGRRESDEVLFDDYEENLSENSA